MKSCRIWASMERDVFGQQFSLHYLQVSYEYNMIFLSNVFYTKLPSKYAVAVAQSCVDFVLPKLFPHINIVFELLQNRKRKSHIIWPLLEVNFRGSIQVCPSCRYQQNIDQLKNPFQMNIIILCFIKCFLRKVAVQIRC